MEVIEAPASDGATVQGDMIPVSDTSEQHIKRVVRVRKQRQELFGWRLSPVDKFLHVIAVDEVTPDYNPTAAYRAGFKFGDRITHVNGQPVSYKTDIYQLMIDLKDSVEVQVDLVDAPLFEKHTFDATLESIDSFGIGYANGMVVEIKDGSPAKKEGMQLETTIVQTNNTSTLGMSDGEVIAAIFEASKSQAGTGHRHFTLVTMNRDQARQLHDGIDLMLKEMPAKSRPRSVAEAVNAYLALDPMMGSTDEIEKVVFKGKADASRRRLSRSNSTEGLSHDVILTPSRQVRQDESSEGVHEKWTYKGERVGKQKNGLPRFIVCVPANEMNVPFQVDGSLLGNIRTKGISFVQEEQTEAQDVPADR